MAEKDTVTVACKMPHGLTLRVFDMVPSREPVPGGGYRETKRAQPRPSTVRLNGYLERYDPSLPPAARGSSYALTHNVPRDFWEAWLGQNQELSVVKNHLVFAHSQEASVKAQTREHEKTRSGLEPIDPADPKQRGIRTYKEDAA